MPWPKKNVIFDANFRTRKWILHLLSSKCLRCLPVDSFGIVFRCGDIRVMTVLWATASNIKSVESRFDGKNGLLSCFVNVEPGLGNFSRYTVMQQQPNIQSTSAGEKNDLCLGTKSNNRTLCFFLGIPIHVGIILTILVWDQYHSKKLVLVSLSKNTFFTSILS